MRHAAVIPGPSPFVRSVLYARPASSLSAATSEPAIRDPNPEQGKRSKQNSPGVTGAASWMIAQNALERRDCRLSLFHLPDSKGNRASVF